MLGYVSAVFFILAVSLDQVVQKNSVAVLGVRNIVYRGFFTTPLMLILGCLTLHFEVRCIPFLLLYCIISFFNMTMANKGLCDLPLPLYGAINNSAPLFTAFLSSTLGLLDLGAVHIFSFALYILGVMGVLELLIVRNGKIHLNITQLSRYTPGMYVAFGSVIARTCNFVVMGYMLKEQMISNEMLLALGMLSTNVIVYAQNHESIDIKREVISNKVILFWLILQMLCVAVGNCSQGIVVKELGVVSLSVLSSFTLLVQLYLLHKQSKQPFSLSILSGTFSLVVAIILFVVN